MGIRKKIALIVYSLDMGGAEKVASDLSFQFAKQHDVSLILFDTRHMYYPYAGELINLNSPAREGLVTRFVNFLQRAHQLRRIFKAKRFDTIIGVMEHASFPAILASRKTIAANHCNPEENFSGVVWWFAKWLYPKAHKVVAVSRDGMEIFRKRLGLDNLCCLYNPVNLQRIRALANEQPAIRLTAPYIVAAGRLRPEKNFAGLIEAYANSRARDKFNLLILGEGDERPRLEQQINQLGLEGKILLPGFMPNPYPYIAKAYCQVLSSLHEGFPVILVEALGLGCPVVATDCETGPREIIEHEKNGLLVAPDNTPELSAALDRLCSDSALHENCRKSASASVEHLDIERVAEQWLAL